jgi:hypothetical protein
MKFSFRTEPNRGQQTLWKWNQPCNRLRLSNPSLTNLNRDSFVVGDPLPNGWSTGGHKN